MDPSLQPILDDCNLGGSSWIPVTGGDINQAFRISGGKGNYFLKVNAAGKFPGMFEKEARGLKILAQTCSLTVPGVIRSGLAGHTQYLLLEWIEAGQRTEAFWKIFGAGLANLHKVPQPFFGWHEDNYVGSLTQVNSSATSWPSFYSEFRIIPLVRKLEEMGSFTVTDVSSAEDFCKNLESIFPEEPPALLHGDLWSGNFLVDSVGNPTLIDPAVYYGHREMDLGMTVLFGGFEKAFYNAYQEGYPLEKGWERRLPLTQLYPILVHAILFGGHYVSRARQILQQS